MRFQKVYHWLTTTRYTRRLESEIDYLMGQIDRLRADNDCLMESLHPQLKSVRTEAKVQNETKAVKPFRF